MDTSYAWGRMQCMDVTDEERNHVTLPRDRGICRLELKMLSKIFAITITRYKKYYAILPKPWEDRKYDNITF